VRSSGKPKLEAHLRIAHEVAVLQTIVRDGERRQPHGAGFVHGFDDQLQVGRVLDLEVQAVVPTSGLSEDVKDGLHQATFASSASGIAACSAVGGCNAARMTPDVCWMGIWEGHGSLRAPSGGSVTVFTTGSDSVDNVDSELAETIASWEDAAEAIKRAPVFHHPGRSYLLAKAPCTAICKLGRWPLGTTPNLVWPDDRAWCVGSEIDFDSTLVATSEECAAALLADQRLETVLVRERDRLDDGGDVLNPRVEWR